MKFALLVHCNKYNKNDKIGSAEQEQDGHLRDLS